MKCPICNNDTNQICRVVEFDGDSTTVCISCKGSRINP